MYSEQRFVNPDRTVVSRNGQEFATFTDGARTVSIKGQRRKFNESTLPIVDSFNRTRPFNWSAADAGGTWQHVGGNKDMDYSIEPQAAKMTVRTAGLSRRSMVRARLRLFNPDFTFGFNLDDPDGGHQIISGLVGYVNVSNSHYMNARFMPANISDVFPRTATGTWGNSSSGKAWTRVGGNASDYSKGGGYGRHHLNSVNVSRRNVIGNTEDTDMKVTIEADQVATGGFISGGLIARFFDPLNYYSFRVRFNLNGTVSGDIQKVLAGTTTTIGANTTTGESYSANDKFNVRAQVVSNALRMKIWRDGDVEPGSWLIDIIDDDISGAARVGTRSILSPTNANTLPVTLSYSNFYAVMDDQSQEIELYVSKSVEGISTQVSEPISIPLRRMPGEAMRMRVQVQTDTINNLRMKVWRQGDPEPSSWDLEVQDAEFMAGKVGMRHYASTYTSTLPVESTYRDFTANGELSEQDQPILYSDIWVRVLDQPFSGTVDYNWLEEQRVNYKPDVLATAAAYLRDQPYTYLPGDVPLQGDANYNYRHPNGDRREGSDWNDYHGVTASYTCGDRPPRPEMFQSIDCSGFTRTVYRQFGMVPDRCAPDFDGVKIPRVTKDIEESGPGVRVIPYVPYQIPTESLWKLVIRPGDVVSFSSSEVNNSDPSPGSELPESRIDHNGIYLGIDEQGNHRFISSRKSVNGPQMSDVSGSSVLEGTGLYARGFRAIRRF